MTKTRLSTFGFQLSTFLIVYMPLHVFIAQAASLATGGLEIWKAAKDVLVFLLLPLLVYAAHRQGVFRNQHIRRLLYLSVAYGLLHGLFLVFDRRDDTYSALVGSVYNTRLLIYLLLGIVVGFSAKTVRVQKILLTAVVLIAGAVSLFGILQYFLPHDMLTHVGYSLERGVKPMFFIDDKPDLPRVMSTLRDPNSFGAYLVVPIMLSGYALIKKGANETLFARPFRRGTLLALLGLQLGALLLTFSRGALIAAVLGAIALLCIVTGKKVLIFVNRYMKFMICAVAMLIGFVAVSWNTYTFQNVVFHADQSTVLADPNELRLSLTKQATADVIETPLGHGPGTAGLVSISNPRGGVLTENYYLQIAYEVGWLGVALFVAILAVVGYLLFAARRQSALACVLLASLLGYAFYSLLIHLWSNEAVALQWWLLAGITIGHALNKHTSRWYNT